MNKKIKTALLLYSSLIIISTGSLVSHVYASEQKNISVMQKKEASLSPIKVNSLTSLWYEFQFENILGNNLDSSGYITPETFQLKLTASRQHIPPLAIISSGGTIIASSLESDNYETSFTLSNELFQPSQEYFLYTTGVHGELGLLLATFNCASMPPTITASSRTVEKDDPNFDIMDGVTALDFEGNDITQNISFEGNVDIHTAGTYPITYFVTDKYGQTATKTVDITVKDTSSGLTPPTLDEVTSSDTTITGTGSPGSQIYIILGTDADTYRTTVKEDGTFILSLDHPYPVGTSITAYAQDEQGNKSESIYSIVQEGVITVGVDQILSSSTSVSGYSSPGAAIEVAISNTRDRIFYGTADSNGKYVVDFHGASYSAGTKVVVTATLNGKSGFKSVIVYPQKVTINTIYAGASTIYGKADPNATVHLSVHSKNYTFTADSAGSFYENIASPLISGDRIIAYQTSNGIESEPTTVLIN